MKIAKVVAELTTIDALSVWLVFTEMHPVPSWISIALKVAIGVSVVTYNIVKTIKVLKSK